MQSCKSLIGASWLLIVAAPLWADDIKSDAEPLQGTWRVVSQQRAGRATARPANMKLIIQGDTIWLVVEHGPQMALKKQAPAEKGETQASKGGKPSDALRGPRMTFRLHTGKATKQIDIEGPGKSASYGIYRLEGDELTLCMGVTQASPTYDKQAISDESTRPARIDPEAGTVIILKRD
jgi:uncharacterized protein (TIGR03067 family)